MGACLGLSQSDDRGNSQQQSGHDNLEQPLSGPDIENEQIEVHVADASPWQYSESLSMDKVAEMLENVTYDSCAPFVAPIKWGKVVKVYDGDTIHVAAPLFEGVISRFRVRLARIDTPELRTKDEWEKKAGLIAKQLVEAEIGDKIVKLEAVSYDKYGRILAEVVCDGRSVNDWLLDSGWACAYQGRGDKLVKQTDWKQKVLAFDSDAEA